MFFARKRVGPEHDVNFPVICLEETNPRNNSTDLSSEQLSVPERCGEGKNVRHLGERLSVRFAGSLSLDDASRENIYRRD